MPKKTRVRTLIGSQHVNGIKTLNMLMASKHCLNLIGSSLVIFFDPSERQSARKILS